MRAMLPALRRHRARITALAVCVLIAMLSGPARTQTGDIAVIVHPDVPITSLTVADLRRLLLGDREFWASGLRVTLLIRAPIARERDAVVKDICQMTEAQFRQHWIGKVFRAESATGPKIVYSTDMTIEQVARTPGAIAFVDAAAAGRGVKILKIDGRSPGQAGYKLK